MAGEKLVPGIKGRIQYCKISLWFLSNYYKMHGGHSVLHFFHVEMVFLYHNIVIPIENQKWNLPVVHNSHLTSKENNLYWSKPRSDLDYSLFRHLDFFIYLRPAEILCHVFNEKEYRIEGEFDNFRVFVILLLAHTKIKIFFWYTKGDFIVALEARR